MARTQNNKKRTPKTTNSVTLVGRTQQSKFAKTVVVIICAIIAVSFVATMCLTAL
jgi:hypothetical protein